ATDVKPTSIYSGSPITPGETSNRGHQIVRVGNRVMEVDKKDNLVLARFPEGERFILAWMRIFLWEMGMLSLSFAGPAMAAADALSIVAAERLTFYHGTSRYVAMEMAESQAVNIERLAMHQADKAFAKGLYTSSQEATANYYADLLFASGRAGGPAIV